MLLIVVLYALLALTFPLAQYALQCADPLALITIRMFLAGGCLLVYFIFSTKQFLIAKKTDRWSFVQAVIFHMYLAFIPEFWALQYISALKANLMYCLTPFISALLEYFLFGKLLSKYNMMGIGLGFIGIMPLVLFLNPKSFR